MALQFKLDSLDGVEESLQSLYTEQDGAYVLSVEGLPQQEDVSGLKAKVDQLLGEKKKAQDAAKREADERAKAERAKAEKENNFEALFKSSEEARQKTEAQLTGLQNQIASEKVNGQAMQIAAELADDKNAKLLSTFIAPRLRYVDGETKIVDASGELTIATTDDLKKEIVSSGDFDSLLRGNKAGGGGANASEKGGGAANETVTRTEFDGMSHNDRREFLGKGGKITDD